MPVDGIEGDPPYLAKAIDAFRRLGWIRPSGDAAPAPTADIIEAERANHIEAAEEQEAARIAATRDRLDRWFTPDR